MGAQTTISWAEATWNPLVGCSLLSPGCSHCYAMAWAHRLEQQGVRGYQGTTRMINGQPVWTGQVNLVEEALTQPMRWTKPRLIFVNSMSDLFHEAVPDEWIDRIFAIMLLCPHHIFQVLTKRPERMYTYLASGPRLAWSYWVGHYVKHQWPMSAERVGWAFDRQAEVMAGQNFPLAHLWLGVSVEDQRRASERIPWLVRTPAAVRFLSCEPLLGPLTIWPRGVLGQDSPLPLHWVIIGAESGPHRRPMEIAWLAAIVQECREAGIKVYVKQGSHFRPGQQGAIPDDLWQLKEYPTHG
ncbi:MAG TPA: phage Gp37/Gp68 family protein [Alphaproteobacteria bacterium]|nr:phage Gp37/Gp68 family protein [Alphaproteobacteria bacterium]